MYSISSCLKNAFIVTIALISANVRGAANTSGSRKVMKGLQQVEAERRVKQVNDVKYTLSFTLDGTSEEFSGKAQIDFTYTPAGKDLTIDFNDGKISAVTVNGNTVTPVQYNGNFLTLPGKILAAGKNKVDIDFTHAYSKTGSGLYRFTDPEDKKIYMYSDFEPYDANLLFPCFDQPDIKATYQLNVTAPQAWTVVSSTRETKVDKIANGRALWTFPESAKFSTYLFSLHAGDYKVWEAKAGDIPLRLFARQTMAKYVKVDEWFTITQQGFAYFQEYFDFKYPFQKYDQIIVPDFNSGAMENVAAVTFSERFIRRGPSTDPEREDLANVILHEMAHMWFGNLVTMKWWNDLWLNESFATYMASKALYDATEFKKAWLSFYDGAKLWAYFEDQLVTTHPIAGEVPDTLEAFSSFDGITYGKGASVFKLLEFHITPDAFRDGVRAYFKKHQYANTELPDFMGALAAAAKQDLKPWSNEWLTKAGLNTVEAKFTCANGKISTFSLEQSAPSDFPTKRTHKTRVGLYKDSADGGIELAHSVDVHYKGKSTTVKQLVGQSCPLFVYPNHDDFDYVKVSLDPKSLAAIKTRIAKTKDPMVRMMLWQSLWDMVRDAEMPVQEYADTIVANIASETQLNVLEKIVQTLYSSRRRPSASIMTYLPTEGAAGEYRKSLAAKFEELFQEQLAKAAPGSDEQKLWFDMYTRSAQSPAAQNALLQFLDGSKSVKGLQIDQDRRWGLIYALSSLGNPQSEALRTAEIKKDPSNTGIQANIEAEAGQPIEAVKKKVFATIVDPKSKRTLAEHRAAMRGIFPVDQNHFRRQFGPEFFQQLTKLSKFKENEFLRPYTDILVPAMCADTASKELAAYIVANPKLPLTVSKSLRVSRQEDERYIKARKVAERYGKN